MIEDHKDKLYTLRGGARIRFLFNDRFTKQLSEINPFDPEKGNLTTMDIGIVIKNASGSKPSLFVPDKAFEMLTQRQIKLLRDPCLKIAEAISNELLRTITETEIPELMRFWKLRDAILEVASELLNNLLSKTQTMINTTIDLELSYINTNHPDFIGVMNSILSKTNVDFDDEDVLSMKEYTRSDGSTTLIIDHLETSEDKTGYKNVLNQMTKREKKQISIIKHLLEAYFVIIKKNIQDHVTKIIMLGLVKSSINEIQKELIGRLYKGDGKSKELLTEAGDVTTKRKACKQELDRFKKAKKSFH